MSIRNITSADVDALEALDRQCFPAEVRYNRFDLGYYLTIHNSVGLLDTAGQELRGFIIAVPLSADTANIVTIDVAPAYRRRGIGSDLLSQAKEIFKSRHVTRISLQVAVDNEPALKFYTKHGFMVLQILKNYYPAADGYQMEYLIE